MASRVDRAPQRGRTPASRRWSVGGLRPLVYLPVGRRGKIAPMTSVLSTLLIALVIGFAVSLLANVCTTVYLHRALAHRAVTLAPSVEWVFRFLLWITTGIQARQWVAVHRKHHAFTGMEGDPHSGRAPRLGPRPGHERRDVPQGGAERGHGGPLRQGHPRGQVGPPAVRPHAARPGHRHRHPGRGLRPGRRACWPRSSTPTCTWAAARRSTPSGTTSAAARTRTRPGTCTGWPS